jgi:small-conductance mechanosensitive channel
MMVKKYMKPGDVIESRLVSGTVLECELLRTVISTETGDVMYVPNSYLIKQTLVVKKVKS